MSFVFAEKDHDIFHIYCDTKIGLEKITRANISEEQQILIEKYGIAKTTIISSEISVSFAGNIFLASELFLQLYKKRVFSVKDVVDMAKEVHMNASPDEIEFIIAGCEDKQQVLFCIKDRKVQENCDFCWIGSSQAHSMLQKYRLESNHPQISDITPLGFFDVVNGCGDDTVGGLTITVVYDKDTNSIKYDSNEVINSSKPQVLKPGEKIKMYLSAFDGGFSQRQIPISCEEFILEIDQMGPSVLYSRNKRCTEFDMKNDQLFSLMLPMLIKKDNNGRWVRC